MEYTKTIPLKDGQTAVVTVDVPEELRAVAKITPDAPREDAIEARPGPLTGQVYDAGTYTAKIPRLDRLADNYFEDLLEGPQVPSYVDVRHVAHYLLAAIAARATLESGEEVSSCYPLQTDAETARTNTTLEVYGERSQATIALAEASEHWVDRPQVADQRETIERLRAEEDDNGDPSWRPQRNNHGFDTWAEELDRRESRNFPPEIAHRVNHEGRLLVRQWPQVTQIAASSEWQYENFDTGDEARYVLTEGIAPTDEEVPRDQLRTARARALDVELYLAPQTHMVRFEWITVYIVSVLWWAFTVFIPQVRVVTMRAMMFPEVFRASGVPSSSNPVGLAMSSRIALTNTYAAAVLSDVQLSLYNPTFSLLFRFQGRYGVYQRPRDAGALCAELRLHYPAETVRLRCFRRVEIWRPLTLLEISGLYTQEVFPFSSQITYVTGGGPDDYPAISDGY